MRYAALLLLLCACVERRLFVRTDPAGALVSVNGKEIGRAPVSWRFDHYGKVRVDAELEGHEPVERVVELKAPAREWVLAGFFTDILYPRTIHDDHHVTVRLPPLPRRSEAQLQRELAALQEAAVRLRGKAEKP